MPPSTKLKRDYIYYAFFSIHLASILLVDLLPLYPRHYYDRDGGVLRWLWHLRQYYIGLTNDPFFQMEHSQLPSWYLLFTYLEVAVQIPMNLWVRSACGDAKEGTDPLFELVAVPYGVQVALTTLVCVWDVAYWDPAVYSVQDKSMFIFGIYGPWVVIPLIFSIDMGRRLLKRAEPPKEETAVEKKTQ